MPPRPLKKPAGGAVATPKKPAKVMEEINFDQPASETKTEENPSAADAAEAKVDVKESCEENKAEHLELEDHEQESEREVETEEDYDGQEEEGDEGEEQDVDEGEGEEAGMIEDGGEGEERDVDEGEGEGEEAEMMEDGGEGDEDVEGEEEEHEVDPEEDEHHEVVKEHRKRKEFEVFVGGLAKEATEDDLKKVFSEVGEVTNVRLMMNPLTKKNRGFAFLRFATVEQAMRAVSELKNPVVNGKQCGVSPSQDADTLFVGNICKTWTKEYLKEKLKNYGIENIEDLTLVEDASNEGMNRGFAFLEFSSRSEAMSAYRSLQKRDVILGTDRIAKVAFADSYIEPDDEVMAQVRTVFVDGLPASWDEDRVKENLKKYGVIEKVELARNMPAAKRKDFGFITFEKHDSAVACAEGINNADLGEGVNKVRVRARLSRPRQKGRGRHGTTPGPLRGGRTSYIRPLSSRIPARPSRVIRGREPIRDLRGGRTSYSRPLSSRIPAHPSTVIRGREPIWAVQFRKPTGFRGRQLVAAMEERSRRLPPREGHSVRSPSIPVYPKSSSKRDYIRHGAPPRRRATADYVSSIPIERHTSYREDYSSRRSDYSDIRLRSVPFTAPRKDYADEGYRYERSLPTFQGKSRDYGPMTRSKRPYSELDDVPRYSSENIQQSRTRLDYEVTDKSTHYDSTYVDRLERSHLGYSGRRALSNQDGLYRSCQGMNQSEGLSRSGGTGIYSPSFSSSYALHGSNVGGSSYTSPYSDRSLGGSGYLGRNRSDSYY